MKLHEKIQSLRKERKLNRIEFHNILKGIFADKAITYRTMERIEKGENDGKGSSLHQIAVGLGITIKELMEGTDEENPPVECIRKYKHGKGRYIYNPDAYAEILTGFQAKFFATELVLQPKAITPIEKDPEEGGFQKWVYVVKGTLDCVITDKKFTLRKGDSVLFYSSLVHSFSNNSSRETRCIIVQNPRHI